jgi:hypothetical protein
LSLSDFPDTADQRRKNHLPPRTEGYPARQLIKFLSSHATLRNLAPAAPSPARAAAAATPTATAAAPTCPTAATATAPAAATATSANNNGGQLHVIASVFLIEEIKRGETDVGHFLFAKDEALIGRDVVGLREIGRGHRGCGCAPRQ